MNEEEIIIEERLKIAPPEIKSYLASGRWEVFSSEISQKNGFSEEQKTLLNNEIITVLLGLDLVQNFKVNIQNSLGLTEFLAQAIDKEVQEKIFSEILNFLPTEDDEEPVPNQPANNLDILSKQEETPIPIKPAPNNTPFIEDKVAPMVEERKWWEQPKDTGGVGVYNIPNIDKSPNSPTSDISAPKPEESSQSLQKEISSQVPEIMPDMDLAIQKEVPKAEVTQTTQSESIPPKIIGLASEPTQVPPKIPTLPTQSQPTQSPPTQSPSFFEKIVPNTNPTQSTQAPKSVVDAALSNLAEDEEEWMKRKNAFANQGNQDRVLRTQYPKGQDPYREPLS